ncbi:MAG: methyl-accepting chemotaxis protein [Methylococcales bacterium]|nr:methyl-accepting chemotaxis protein [Methylococcales bacterium]
MMKLTHSAVFIVGASSLLTGLVNGLVWWWLGPNLAMSSLFLVSAAATALIWQRRLQQRELARLRQFFQSVHPKQHINLDQRYPDDNAYGEALNQLLAHMHEAVAAIQNSASRLFPMAQDLTDTFSVISQKAVIHQSYNDTASHAMQSMHAAADDIARHAEKIQSTIDQEAEDLAQTRTLVAENVAEIEHLAEKIYAAAQQAEQLNQHSEQVRKVIDVINNIAEQTNLLALNAAIEAARAGEHGRGFAVVADEVRTLSERTRESTRDVRKMIDQIGHSTHAVVQSMTESKTAMDGTLDKSRAAETQLADLIDALQAITRIAQDLEQANQRQTTILHDTLGQVAAMNELNEAVIKGKIMYSISSDDLINLGDKLKATLAVFHLPGADWSAPKRNQVRNQDGMLDTGDELELW